MTTPSGLKLSKGLKLFDGSIKLKEAHSKPANAPASSLQDLSTLRIFWMSRSVTDKLKKKGEH